MSKILYPYPTFNRYLKGIYPNSYVLVGGHTGVGTSSFIDYTFIINTILKYKDDCRVLVLLTKDSKDRRYKKWQMLCKYIESKGSVLYDLMDYYDDEELFDNLNNYKKFIDKYVQVANNVSDYENIERLIKEFTKKYIDKHTVVILDDINSIYTPVGGNIFAEMDRVSKMIKRFRSGSVKVVSTEIPETIDNFRIRNHRTEPELRDFRVCKGDADIVFGIYNPSRDSLKDYKNYDMHLFRDSNGADRFRSIKILRNSLGIDNIRKSFSFIGEVGYYQELPTYENLAKSIGILNQQNVMSYIRNVNLII